ncbi:MAG TPA: trigger factor [Phototrophicaceae bacterium]|nr:trigger factor [Phototrophicaceae bacterium]
MNIKVDIDELSPVQRKVRVELPAETVADEFSRAYKNLGRRVRVRGFRTGKIPRPVLQGIYGDEVKGEVRSHLVEESLAEIVRERGLQIVSRPELESNDLRETESFSFSAVFEIKPQIEVKDYLGLPIEKPRIAVTEAQVDEALRRLQENHARLEPVVDREVVEKGDFVTLDFEGSLDGKPFSGGKAQNYVLEVGAGQALAQFEEAVVGLKLGERKTVSVTYPEDFPNKEIAGRLVEFSLVAHEIKRKVLPALDDDFAKDHGECASLEELKNRLRQRLQEEMTRYQTDDLKEQALSRLIERHSFSIPQAMVERQTRYLMERYQNQMGAQRTEQPAPMEEVRKTLEERAMRQVRATLLVEKIAELEKIEVSDKEVQERVDLLARAAGEQAKNLREYYARSEARDDLRTQMIFDRTLGFLLDRATVREIDAQVSKVDDQLEKR